LVVAELIVKHASLLLMDFAKDVKLVSIPKKGTLIKQNVRLRFAVLEIKTLILVQIAENWIIVILLIDGMQIVDINTKNTNRRFFLLRSMVTLNLL
jgi:hypothetical protein